MLRIVQFTLLAVLIAFLSACSLISGNNSNGIPIMPQATGGQATKTAYTYKAQASIAEVDAFYAERLPALGWQIVGDAPSTVIAAKKGTSTVEITIFNNLPDGVSVLTILHQ